VTNKTTLILSALTLWVVTSRGVGGQRPAPSAIAHAVDSLAVRIVNARLTPALGVAVVMDGRTVLSRSYGLADETNNVRADDHTLWYLASTSKSLTGFGVSLLAQEGALRLDAPITELLPGVRWHAEAQASKLTLARFLSHTHYLNDNAVVTSAAFTGAVPESRWPQLVQFAAPSGNTDMVYSNFGYNVAAMVIDAKRPEGWRRYLEQAVYAPAGMTDTYARVSGLDRRRIAMPHALGINGAFTTSAFQKTDATMNSAGGHLATLSDLARWITVQMDSGVLDGQRVFPAAAVATSHRMIAPHTVAASKRFAYFDREGWSAGWDIGSYEGERMVSRFGSYHSIRSHASMLPGRRIGVVAQANGRPGWIATDLIAAFAYDLEAGRANARTVAEQRLQALIAERDARIRQVAVSDSTRASRQRTMNRPLSDFTGTFANDAYGRLTLSLRNGTLFYSWGVLSGPVEIFDAARHQLRIEFAGGGNVVSYAFTGPGPAASLEFSGATLLRVP
jgi:CubicO group peptidase (beta-lactamase class C family)